MPHSKAGKLENEWVQAHSKRKLLRKRVDPNPLESNILIRTSGYTPFAKLHIM